MDETFEYLEKRTRRLANRSKAANIIYESVLEHRIPEKDIESAIYATERLTLPETLKWVGTEFPYITDERWLMLTGALILINRWSE